MDAGHTFNTGVVYLPPSGVRDGVAELVRVNPELKKIVIITEKIAVHDAREIRAMAQANGVDIIGGNCLGVADSLEPRPHRRGARRRPSRRVADQGIGGDLLELRRLHHDDRPVPRHRRLGDDDADLERQGPLHPLRLPGLRPRLRRRRPLGGGGALCRARRLLRAWARMDEAGRRLRRRPLEVEADPRRRPCRRHGRLRRPGRGQGTLVHGGLRGRRDLHAGEPGGVEERRGRHQHRRHPGGADRGDGAERRRARLRPARQPRAEAVARQRPGPAPAGGDRAAAGDGARALCRADRDARPPGRRGRRPADDEGQVGRVA